MILCDTNIVLRWMIDPESLAPRVSEMLQYQPCSVSIAALWEIEIKRWLGKLALPDDFDSAFDDQGFDVLGVEVEDVRYLGNLPAVHSDPFDRIMIAQALRRGWPVATTDGTFASYGVGIL